MRNLNEKAQVYKYQSGFRASFSTDSCLTQLTDFALTDTEKGMHTGMIFIDLQKVFDTLDYKISQEKKQKTCLGFKTTIVKCFDLIY